MNLNNDFKCNICDTHNMRLFNYKGTFIYICDDCPNIQFEFIDYCDIENLKEFLYLENIDEFEVKQNDKVENF